jgi:hypothetical protein
MYRLLQQLVLYKVLVCRYMLPQEGVQPHVEVSCECGGRGGQVARLCASLNSPLALTSNFQN